MYCEECGEYYAERHHIVFRSQGGLNFPENFKWLCATCHRGKDGPHKNRKKDLRYKQEMQAQLQIRLFKPYYTAEGLQKALKLQKNQVKRITKTLNLYSDGYKSEDVIRRLMGGKSYL